MISFKGLNFGEGWRPDLAAEAVPKAIEAYGLRTVGAIIPRTAPRDFVDLTVYPKAVWGDSWELNQSSCGSCVAFGLAGCADVLTAIATVASGSREKPLRSDPMTIYWGSRNEIGGGRIRGEGSVGVWAAQYAQKFGILPQQKYDQIDLSKYDPSVCCGRQSNKGVPDELEPIARKHPIKNYGQVRSFDDAVAAMDLERPVTVASDRGFTFELDREGFARPSGTWNHQMFVAGYRLGRRPGGLVVNSWGRVYKGGPAGHHPATKWVDADVLDGMFRQGDSWAYNDMDTWIPRGVDFSKLNYSN